MQTDSPVFWMHSLPCLRTLETLFDLIERTGGLEK